MTDKKWLDRYENIKEKLYSKVDLEKYFSEKQIEGVNIDTLEIGTVHFPTGIVFACDPFFELEDRLPYIQKIPIGTYPVKICVVLNEKYGARYACVKVVVNEQKPIRYEMAMTGKEDLEEDFQDGEFFGFGVDAGMACIADIQAQEEYKKYWKKRREEDSTFNLYNNIFCDILAKNYQENPKYQQKEGDWANWVIPGTDCNILIFSSGWGDGGYPCYFGYDENNAVCGIYIWFINIPEEF